jgi:hypothetical protein
MEGVHFDLTYIDLKHLGYKSAMVNISDVFAMNGTPRQVTVSLAISKRFSVEDIEAFYEGLRLACDKWNVDIVGGDTTSSYTGLAISITCIGEAAKEDIVYRNGAKNTDLICVSGDLGAAYMGLQLLEREKSVYYQQVEEAQKKNDKKALEMLAHFQPQIESVKKYVGRKIGRFEQPVYSRDGFFGNSAFTDLIHNLQMQISGAEVSFNAPLAFNNVIKAGDVTQADMFKLYRFENLMFVLRMTGEEIRKHLEFSYDMWTNTMTSPDDHALRLNDNSKGDQQRTGFQYYTFNFDSACGIDYEVDLTKPDGQKVRILRMSNGEPFDEHRWYKVVMNSYRANGGGELLTLGAGIPKDSLESRVLWHTDMDQRHYLTEEIHRQGTINPQPNNNWKFVPEEWTKPALERDRKKLFGE